ncbi:MAG: TonB-dependent receptor [Caldimonas sp.]
MTLSSDLPCRRAAAFLALAILTAGASAQAGPDAAPPRPVAAAASAASAATPTSRSPTTLAPVIVTGNPLGSSEIASPSTVLAGDELVLRRGSSLGETLNGLPGVSSTYFGPNANRPVIRGLDGDRIRLLNNAGASFDASSLSFDHAVPIDPLTVERIEVLRGPGALLYGGNAIGGVVNAIDNRIPKDPLSGLSGSAELRLGGAERERGGSALLEAGNGSLAVHADAFRRETSDLSVPWYTPVEADGTALARTDRIRNSASRSDGGALGASWTFGSGYLGVSADTYESHYGIVAEEDVIIRMKRGRLALAGELRALAGPFRSVRARLDDTRYKHVEVEGSGEIGTTFKTAGTGLRVEAEHAPWGTFKGVVGVQLERFDFSALGEEAFVPTTDTRRRALFLLEEAASPIGTLSGGVRIERDVVSSRGDTDPEVSNFGPPTERSFNLKSASIGDVWQFAPLWSLSASLSSTARAPTAFELFANGVHVATGAFERGDPALGIERGNNLDLAVAWKDGANRIRLGAYVARFSDFISLEATGVVITEESADGEQSFPEFQYRAIRAELRGVEIEASHRLELRTWAFDVSGKLDSTRARNRDSGAPLPRIPPLRVTVGVDAAHGPWLGRLEVEHAWRQDRVPALDSETAGYTIVNAALTHRFALLGKDAFWFVKATNLTDKLAYSATTVDTIRGLVPLPGRAVKAGLRVAF